MPESLPALLYARKVQRRVESVGYDWPDIAGPLAEGLGGATRARGGGRAAGEPEPQTEPDARLVDEVGDVLFTVVNVARRLNVDPELALRGDPRKFRDRVERAVELAAERGEQWAELSLDEQERYYELAKEALR